MLSDANRKQAADILMAAAKERKQAVQLSKTWPDITIEDAYAISTEVANRRIAAGAKLIGHKVGLTSKAMQRSSQIDEPDYGHLLDDMMIADGAKVPHEIYCGRGSRSSLLHPRQAAQGPGCRLPDVLRATEYVVPAIEIVDARLQDPRKIFDTVADNGRRRHRHRGPSDRAARCRPALGRRPHVLQLRDRGDRRRGRSARPPGAWRRLARQQARTARVTLEPGHLILAGSFTRVVFAKKGDTLHAISARSAVSPCSSSEANIL